MSADFPWEGEAARLAQRVAAFQDTSLAGTPSEPFEGLLLDLAAYQAKYCPVRRALTPHPATRLETVAVLPASLWRDLAVGTVTDDEAAVVFRTSGTTGGRGVHRLRSTALYDRGALAWARRCLAGDWRQVVGLVRPPSEVPDSSLSHMVARFSAWSSPGIPVDFVVGEEGLRASALAAALGGPGPLLVGATAFALADWLDQRPSPLPPGSLLFVTGGFKGRRTDLDTDQLYALAREALRPAQLWVEYGMTELSSQLWGPAGQPLVAPPWLRVVAADPATGQHLAPGQVGLLRFYDLANLDSSVTLETEDLGAVDATGRRVQLLGRRAEAPLRGCSLSFEDLKEP